MMRALKVWFRITRYPGRLFQLELPMPALLGFTEATSKLGPGGCPYAQTTQYRIAQGRNLVTTDTSLQAFDVFGLLVVGKSEEPANGRSLNLTPPHFCFVDPISLMPQVAMPY